MKYNSKMETNYSVYNWIEPNPFDLADAGAQLNATSSADYTWTLVLLHVGLALTTLIKVAVCLATTVSALLLIYLLRHCPQLIIVPSHRFLRHYGIAAIIYFFVLPLYTTVENGFINIRPRIEYCIVYQLEATAVLLMIFCGIALVTYWWWRRWRCFTTSKIIDFIQKYPVHSLYCLMAVKSSISVTMCIYHSDTNHLQLLNDLLRIIYLFAILYVVLANCLTGAILPILRGKSSYSAQYDESYLNIVGTFMVLAWLPAIFYHFLLDALEFHNENLVTVLEFLLCLPQIVTFSAPIFVVLLLRRHNGRFQLAYQKLSREPISFEVVDSNFSSAREPNLESQLSVTNECV